MIFIFMYFVRPSKHGQEEQDYQYLEVSFMLSFIQRGKGMLNCCTNLVLLDLVIVTSTVIV